MKLRSNVAYAVPKEVEVRAVLPWLLVVNDAKVKERTRMNE